MIVLPEPVPGPGELLLDVRAAALNWSDLLQRAGTYPGGPTAAVHRRTGGGRHRRRAWRGRLGAADRRARRAITGARAPASSAVVPAATCFAWDASVEQRAALPVSLLTAC